MRLGRELAFQEYRRATCPLVAGATGCRLRWKGPIHVEYAQAIAVSWPGLQPSQGFAASRGQVEAARQQPNSRPGPPATSHRAARKSSSPDRQPQWYSDLD